VVYGVQRVPGLPVFVDTKSNDPNNIYIAYAICEGEIGGLYDLYIDDNPTVCQNLEDFDDRKQTANNENRLTINFAGVRVIFSENRGRDRWVGEGL
jgi:hypothetical protein